MPKRYFARLFFAELPNVGCEEYIGKSLFPITQEEANMILEKLKAVALKHNQNVAISLWVENEDGSEEEILVPELLY